MGKFEPFTISNDHDMDPSYQLLIGPNGFKCRLTEPEDRTFHRDLAVLVDELNRLYAENSVLLYKIDELNDDTLYLKDKIGELKDEIQYMRETNL